MADITDIVHRVTIGTEVREQNGKGVLLLLKNLYTGGNDETPDTTDIIGRFEAPSYETAEQLGKLFEAGVKIGAAFYADRGLYQPLLDREVNHIPGDPSCN